MKIGIISNFQICKWNNIKSMNKGEHMPLNMNMKTNKLQTNQQKKKAKQIKANKSSNF